MTAGRGRRGARILRQAAQCTDYTARSLARSVAVSFVRPSCGKGTNVREGERADFLSSHAGVIERRTDRRTLSLSLCGEPSPGRREGGKPVAPPLSTTAAATATACLPACRTPCVRACAADDDELGAAVDRIHIFPPNFDAGCRVYYSDVKHIFL